MRFTAIDFETANGDRSSICAVGLAMVENGRVVGRMSQLIRPEPLRFDPINISIHGITPREVAGAPTFAEYWPRLWPQIRGPLAAHNAAFDVSCLRHALDQCGAPYPETDYYCTLVLSRIAWPRHGSYALNHIARSLGIVFRHHDAEEDAAACAMVLLAACRQFNAAGLDDLRGAAGLRKGKLFHGGYYPCGGPCGPRRYYPQ